MKAHCTRLGIEPAKRGNVFWWKARVKDDGGRPNDGPGIECAANATFGVVPHEQAAKLKAGVLECLRSV